MPNPSVNISGAGGVLSVNNPEVHISKGRNEEVIWTSSVPNVTVTITFINGPFRQDTFQVRPNGSTPSGNVRSDAPANGTNYKYSMSAPGFPTVDPNVIVDN